MMRTMWIFMIAMPWRRMTTRMMMIIMGTLIMPPMMISITMISPMKIFSTFGAIRSVSEVNDKWFANEAKARREVGLLERPIVEIKGNENELTCGICFDTNCRDEMKATVYGHHFCNMCWTGQIVLCKRNKINLCYEKIKEVRDAEPWPVREFMAIMVKCSNSLVGLLNFITFLLSIPIIGGGIWLAKKASTDCEKLVEKPIIVIGVFLMVVSLLGLCGAWCGASCLLWIYLVVMFLLIALLFCFTVFTFVVTNKGAGEVLSDKGYKDYNLDDYANWLQKCVQSSGNWKKIRSCVYDSKIYQHLADDDKGLQDQFFSRHLSSIAASIWLFILLFKP